MNTLFKDAAALAARSPVAGTVKDVLDDLVALAFNLLAEGRFSAKAGLYTIPVQSPYMVELDKYAADLEGWASLQGLCMTYMQAVKDAEPFADVLGAAYDEHLGKVNGQFLTPAHVAGAMPGLIIGQPMFRRVCDPACGAGALLLGYLRATHQLDGAKAVSTVSLVANDLDPAMCRMTTVQVVMGSIVHRLPLRSISVACSNVIEDYLEKHGVVFEAHKVAL